MLRAALLILAKDLRLRLRDRSVLVFAVLVPLGLTVLFSFILPGEQDIELTGAVVDADGGPIGAAFAQQVVPALAEAGVLVLVEVADEDAARAALTDGELTVAWVVPEGTSDAITRGDGAELRVLVADGSTLHGEVARGVASAYASQVAEVRLAAGTAAAATGEPPDDADVAALGALAAELPPLASVAAPGGELGRRMDTSSYLAAGMAAFFVFFTVQWGVTGLLEERVQGTLPRLLAAPIRPAAVQAGKVLGAFVLGVGATTVLAVASHLVLGADWGPTLAVAILVVALVVSALGVMALVGSVAKTAEQAGNYQSTVAVVLGLLGGVFFPLPGDAALLRLATQVSPHGWFLRGLQDALATGMVRSALPAAAALVAFGLVAAAPAVVLQRRARW